MPGDELAAVFKGCFRSSLQAAAARNFHADNGHALNVIVPDDLSQLFGIVDIIQLGTSDQCDLTLHKLFMHIGVGISRAVRCDQQLRIIVEMCLRRQELDLTGPLL